MTLKYKGKFIATFKYKGKMIADVSNPYIAIARQYICSFVF